MNKYFKLTGILFFLCVFFLMSSCANDDTTAANTSTSASTGTITSTDAQATTSSANATSALPATLDKIWIEAAAFNALPNARLVFSFAIENPDFLTLYGWSCRGNPQGDCSGQYDHDPNLKLKKGQSSGVGSSPIFIWENVILDKGDVRNIKAQIGAFLYVLFVPENSNGHINYKIWLSRNDPTKSTGAFQDTYTGIDANPSPPKNTSN